MFTLRADEKVVVTLVPVDSLGNPASVENIVWEISDATLLTLVVSPDNMSAEVITVGPLGTARLTVRADARIGEGTKELIALEDFTIVNAEASSLGLSVGVPTSRV